MKVWIWLARSTYRKADRVDDNVVQQIDFAIHNHYCTSTCSATSPCWRRAPAPAALPVRCRPFEAITVVDISTSSSAITQCPRHGLDDGWSAGRM